MPGLTVLVVAISLFGHVFCAGAFYILASSSESRSAIGRCSPSPRRSWFMPPFPISIGGWGIREAVTAALFGLVGYAPASAVALSIAFGLLMSAVGIVCGAFALLITVQRRT